MKTKYMFCTGLDVLDDLVLMGDLAASLDHVLLGLVDDRVGR